MTVSEQNGEKKNYVVSCIRTEFSFCWVIYVVAAFFVFGFLLLMLYTTKGTAYGLSNIKNTTQLEKFLSEPDNSGRLYADFILPTNLQVNTTTANEKTLGFQLGGAYVETPSFTVSTYDKTYDIYFAALEDNLLIVLFGDILKKDKPGLDKCKTIDIYNHPMDTSRLINDLKLNNPEFFSLYKRVYIVTGDYPVSFIKPAVIALSLFVLAALLLRFLPYLYPIQRLSYFGRQIAAAAKAEGRTFKEMRERINEYAQSAYYKNGTELITGRYLILQNKKTSKVLMTEFGDQLHLYAVSDTYGGPYIQSMTVIDGSYPDEMNDIAVTTSDGKRYRMTIHQGKEDVEALLGKLGF